MTAPLKIDPARCLDLAAWAREVAQVRDEDVVAGADAEAKARTRENMAAIADQLDAAAHAAERWLTALDELPTDGGDPSRGQSRDPRIATQQGAATPGQGATEEGAVPGRPATSQSRMLDPSGHRVERPPSVRSFAAALSSPALPPLDPPSPRIPTTEELRALQQPATVTQPRSIPNGGPAVVDLVIADLRERAQHGEAKYGVRLQAHNGRVALVEAYQEVLDLAQYIRQEIEERRRAAEAWRSNPPTLGEVSSGMSWWWHRQRGEDGYCAPHCSEIGWDDDGLFFVEPDCARVTPEEYGDGVEWAPTWPPGGAR